MGIEAEIQKQTAYQQIYKMLSSEVLSVLLQLSISVISVTSFHTSNKNRKELLT